MKARKKPVVIEVEQFTARNYEVICNFLTSGTGSSFSKSSFRQEDKKVNTPKKSAKISFVCSSFFMI